MSLIVNYERIYEHDEYITLHEKLRQAILMDVILNLALGNQGSHHCKSGNIMQSMALRHF